MNLFNNFIQKKNTDIVKYSGNIIFTAHSAEVLNKYIKSIVSVAPKVVWLPKTKKRITLLKSPHVNKRAKEHFELTLFKVNISFSTFSSEKYIEQKKFILLNKPSSVQAKFVWNHS